MPIDIHVKIVSEPSDCHYGAQIAIIWPFPLHFLACLVTFLAVTTTVMLTLGISCTETLVTHMGWWCGAIFALSGYLSGAGVVQNMAIVGSKSGLYGGLFPG